MSKQRKWRGLFKVACFVVLLGFVVPAAGADDKGLYVRGGLGLIFFRPPEMDTFPFHETLQITGNVTGRNLTPWDFDSQDNEPTGHLALGYIFDPSQRPGWLGQDFCVELSSNVYFPDHTTTKTPLVPQGDPDGVWLVGAYYSDEGMKGLALLGFSGPAGNLVSTYLPLVRLSAFYNYVDFNLGARTKYALIGDRLFLSPYVGVIYGMLDQRFRISAAMPDDLARAMDMRTPHQYEVKQNIDTHYWGGTFGLDFIVRIIDGLTFTVGGTMSPLFAYTDMDIKFWGHTWTASEMSEGILTKVQDSEHTLTFRATGKAELAYRIAWFKAGLSGIVQYWDYVPYAEYPRYSAGDWMFNNRNTYPSDVPRLDDDNMTNWIIMLTATFFLPWP